MSPDGTDEDLADSANEGVPSRTVSARPADCYRGDSQRALAYIKFAVEMDFCV